MHLQLFQKQFLFHAYQNLTIFYFQFRGHGTQVVEDRLQATVCGVVDRVNKLVTVRPLHRRYVAEIGDVVVGRVTEVRAS